MTNLEIALCESITMKIGNIFNQASKLGTRCIYLAPDYRSLRVSLNDIKTELISGLTNDKIMTDLLEVLEHILTAEEHRFINGVHFSEYDMDTIFHVSHYINGVYTKPFTMDTNWVERHTPTIYTVYTPYIFDAP